MLIDRWCSVVRVTAYYGAIPTCHCRVARETAGDCHCICSNLIAVRVDQDLCMISVVGESGSCPRVFCHLLFYDATRSNIVTSVVHIVLKYSMVL